MKQSSRNRYEEELAKENACYVLITCKKPNKDGHMHVEMTHGGDAELASYLLQGAQSAMDQNLQEESCFETDLRVVK